MTPPLKHLPALLLLLALVPAATSVAPKGEAPAEIRLGQPRASAPKPDLTHVRAIERFMGARQSASLDRAREPAARRFLATGMKVNANTLAGEPGTTLVAFDFSDGSIERLGTGRFRVTVYVLFADRHGRVTESRDEVLTFSGAGSSFVCSSLKTTSMMRWVSDDVVKSAGKLGARQALERADVALREWAVGQPRLGAYSIEDVYPVGSGRIMIPCLKFTADFGKRGYDVVDAPIIMKRGTRGYMLEPVAN
jgi:hypothetical protein